MTLYQHNENIMCYVDTCTLMMIINDYHGVAVFHPMGQGTGGSFNPPKTLMMT